MFNEQQVESLSADLDRKHVKQRDQSGRKLSYIEGWHAIAEANRIFGFDGWTRETIELKCVSEREREIGQARQPGFGVTYIAKVRVTVGPVVREGCGTGHGIDRDLGQAHESALKEAETDAMKRALMTFGNPFGLALYDKEQAHVSTPAPEPSNAAAKTYLEAAKAAMRTTSSERDLIAWWKAEQGNRHKYGLNPNEGIGLELVTAYGDRKAELQSDLLIAG